MTIIPFAMAAILAIAASFYILLTPVTITGLISEGTPGTPPAVEHVRQQVSWYEAQGAWGIDVLFIFALTFSSTWLFASRTRYGLLAVFSLAGVVLSLLASFSIGILYYPSALAVIIGWLLITFARLRESRGDNQS